MLEGRWRKLNPDRVEIGERAPLLRKESNDEVLSPYTPWQARDEAMRCLYCHEPQCVAACPIGQDCREYNLEISEGRFADGARIILRDNPLALTLSRVCYHYCQDACVVGIRGEPVAIRHLKRAALQYGAEADTAYERAPPRGPSVAVVGGGPAGLMVAWILGQKGYAVTVFEARDILGGLATLTIPLYRLPREVFEQDMERMRSLGIRFEMNRRMGRDFTLDGLREEFDAVFLGIGTHASTGLRVPGADLPGVEPALRFLEEAALGRRTGIGSHVAVVGGGDVAMDCARVALRLGARDVHLVYRRSREEMPASDEEVRETADEGVVFDFLTAPVRVEGNGRVERLVCQRMQLGAPDASGRRKPVPIPGSEFAMTMDAILLAIGQGVDLSSLPAAKDLGISADDDGVIVGLDETGRTNLPDVYVGGGTSVVHAMAAGKRAAGAMESFLENANPTRTLR